MTSQSERESLSSTRQSDSPAPTPIPGAQAWRPHPEHPKRILVADDESLSAASVVLCLRQLGYSTIGPAHDGEHAIELAYSTLPDLALLDARMSTDEDGIEAASALFRELMLPVVIVSAYADRRQVANAAAAEVFGYLVKPATKDQIRPAIEVAWSRFREYMTKQVEAEALKRNITDRRDIEQAKWAMVESGDLDESNAIQELRRRAKASGRMLADVARDVLSKWLRDH